MDKAFKRNFLKGSTAATIGQVSSMLFQFLSITILTRSMEVKEFGLYSLILVISYLFNTLGSFGLEVTLVKFITSEDSNTKKIVLFPVLVLKFITTILFCLIFYIFSNLILSLFDKSLTSVTFFITLLIFLGSFRDIFYNLLQGLNLFKKYAIVQTLSAFIRVFSIVAFIYLSILTFYNLILIETITTVIAIILLIFSLPIKKLITYSANLQFYKKIIDFTLPVYFNNVFTIIYSSSNTFIIGIFLTPVSVAYYDVASKIPAALKKLFNSFILVYFPSLSTLLSKGDKKSALTLINKSIGIFSISLGVLVFLSLILGKEIISVLFSEKYLGVYIAFVLLLFNFQLRTLADIMGYSILASGHPEIPMKVNIFTSIICLGSALIFIPLVGYMGAVYGLLMMNIVSLIQYYYYMKKLDLGIDLTKLLQPILILIIAGLVFYVLPNGINLYVKVLFLILYLAVNWIFIGEVKLLFKSLRKFIPILNKS